VWFGGPVQDTKLSLWLRGEKLDPVDVTRALRAKPTASHRKGELVGRPPGRVAKLGTWKLESTLPATAEPEWQLWDIFDRTTQDLRMWRRLTKRFKADLTFGIFLDTSNRGFELSPEVMRAVARRGLRVGFDIYAP
jgi:hypothetical protein